VIRLDVGVVWIRWVPLIFGLDIILLICILSFGLKLWLGHSNIVIDPDVILVMFTVCVVIGWFLEIYPPLPMVLVLESCNIESINIKLSCAKIPSISCVPSKTGTVFVSCKVTLDPIWDTS